MNKEVKDIEVSVVMPVYNSQQFVGKAISSILKQSFRKFEFIIINDGSNDKSEEIILSFKDERIIYVNNKKNLGLIASLNIGIQKSKGKYIARMDADDISLSSRFEHQVNFLNQNPGIGVCGSWYYSFPSFPLIKVKGHSDSEILRTVLLFSPCLCHPATMIRKKVLTENNLQYSENAKHLEDYDLWVRMSSYCKISNVGKFLFRYRNHPGQISNTHNAIQKKSGNLIREKYLSQLGFTFSVEELSMHNFISSNAFIKSKNQLSKIENWLITLCKQNSEINKIDKMAFNYFIGKMWADSCGNTNLGIWAFNTYFKSEIALNYPMNSKDKIKFRAKCLLRKFKKI